MRDWRVTQLQKMANVTVYRDNRITADDVLAFGAEHVVLATGCSWRRDGYGRSNGRAISGLQGGCVFTPDDLMRGALPNGPVLLFDDDSFYMGSLMAEVLRAAGREVIYLTPDDTVASWTTFTQEYRHVQKRMHSLGLRMITAHNLLAFDGETAQLASVYSSDEQRVACASIVTITARLPHDELQRDLETRESEWRDAGVESVRAIGDCLAPGLIAHAVYEGHRCAQELDAPVEGEVRFRRIVRR